jgi:multiple sugar transport system substrate-binding protein
MAAACGQPSGQPAPGERGQAPVTLEVWYSGSGDANDQLHRRLFDSFRQKHPGITVNGQPGLNSLEKLTAAITAGTPPDLTSVPNPPQYGGQGMALAIDEFLARDRRFRKDDYWETPWERGRFYGKAYGLPIYTDTRLLWWNKAHFQQAGLDPSRPPRTWSELKQMARRLTQRAPDGAIAQLGFSPLFAQSFFWMWRAQSRASKTSRQYFSDEKVPRALWNDQAGVDALTFMAETVKEVGGYTDVTAFQQGLRTSGGQFPLFTGKMSMVVMGNWIMADLKQYAPQLDYGLAPEPVPDKDGQRATMAGGYFWMIPTGTKHKDAVWELVKHLLEDPNLLEFCKVRDQLPAKKSVAADPYFAQGTHKPFIEAIAWSIPFFELPYGGEIWAAINEARDLAVSGQVAPRQALDEAVRKANLAIETYFRERLGITR